MYLNFERPGVPFQKRSKSRKYHDFTKIIRGHWFPHSISSQYGSQFWTSRHPFSKKVIIKKTSRFYEDHMRTMASTFNLFQRCVSIMNVPASLFVKGQNQEDITIFTKIIRGHWFPHSISSQGVSKFWTSQRPFSKKCKIKKISWFYKIIWGHWLPHSISSQGVSQLWTSRRPFSKKGKIKKISRFYEDNTRTLVSTFNLFPRCI